MASASDDLLKSISKALLDINSEKIPLVNTFNNLNTLMRYTNGDEDWLPTVYQYMVDNIKDPNSGKQMFKSTTEAQHFLQSLKDHKRLEKQLKYRLPTAFIRLQQEKQELKLNPMLARSLSSPSNIHTSSTTNKIYA